ncbi:MAG: hypothetical protein ABI761_07470, partial [Saprospiraceae bacterium]
MFPKLILLIFALYFVSCQKSVDFKIQSIPVPYKGYAETPNFYLSPQGNLFLSWIQYQKDSTTSLLFSRMDHDAWSKPIQVASGKNWIVNWADFPSIATFPSSELSILAQYLIVEDTSDPEHYDIRLALARDGGDRFRTIDSLHHHSPAEHGFVSQVPYSFDKILSIWLDGGDAESSSPVEKPDDHSHHGSSTAMQLRSAMIDFDGKIADRLLIDDRVCDCCQTDACMTPKGPMLVYRNRSEDEIRDIYYTRYEEGHWTNPKAIHDDHWKINGCPVNGPAIAALGNKVAITWYTEINKIPKVQMTYSTDGGNTFSDPIEIKTQFTLGRLDIIWLDDHQIAVSFLDKSNSNSEFASIKLSIHNITAGTNHSINIDRVSSKRKTGFP